MYLTRQARKFGGVAKKWVSPGWGGAPDRIVLLPGGRVAFVELKRPGAELRRLQVKRAQELMSLGLWWYRAQSKEDVDRLLEEMRQ